MIIKNWMTPSILMSLMLFINCDKGFPDLKIPEKTTTGANTFGCLINKGVWTNYGQACFTFGCDESNLDGYLYKNPDGKYELMILARYSVRQKHTSQTFEIVIPDLTSTGIYKLDQQQMIFIIDDHGTSYRNYGIGNAMVNITRYDTINMIVSGEFDGNLSLESKPPAYIVTEGRFDLEVK